MTDDTSQWLTTRDVQQALAGRRDTDIKVEINGILVPLAKIYYEPADDCWVLAPYDGDDLKGALLVGDGREDGEDEAPVVAPDVYSG